MNSFFNLKLIIKEYNRSLIEDLKNISKLINFFFFEQIEKFIKVKEFDHKQEKTENFDKNKNELLVEMKEYYKLKKRSIKNLFKKIDT